MHFQPNHIYHVYNCGNEKQKIFFTRENYLFLLKKIRAEWLPYCEPLAYCLMPNHFHFIVLSKKEGCEQVVLKDKLTHLQTLSKAIGKTLSSYTIAFNKYHGRTGNLFQKKTKAKLLCSEADTGTKYNYLANCISYVHQNPKAACLVEDALHWEFSSLQDYAGIRNGTLCAKNKVFALTKLRAGDFLKIEKAASEMIDEMF